MEHKYLTFVLTLLMSMAASVASAHDFEVDGIYYRITSSTSPYTVAVTYRGDFWYFTYTGSVIIPESVTYNSTTYSVTSIGHNAFNGCTGLTSVTIPNSVTDIGSSVFGVCLCDVPIVFYILLLISVYRTHKSLVLLQQLCQFLVTIIPHQNGFELVA